MAVEWPVELFWGSGIWLWASEEQFAVEWGTPTPHWSVCARDRGWDSGKRSLKRK